MEVYKAVLTSKNYQNREVAEYVENCYSYPSLAVIPVFMSKVLQGFETLAYPWWYKEALDTGPIAVVLLSQKLLLVFSSSKKNAFRQSVCGSQQMGNIGLSMKEEKGSQASALERSDTDWIWNTIETKMFYYSDNSTSPQVWLRQEACPKS